MKLSFLVHREEEHSLITQYTQRLPGQTGPEYMAYNLPSSPAGIIAALDLEQRDELEAIIQELEEENR